MRKFIWQVLCFKEFWREEKPSLLNLFIWVSKGNTDMKQFLLVCFMPCLIKRHFAFRFYLFWILLWLPWQLFQVLVWRKEGQVCTGRQADRQMDTHSVHCPNKYTAQANNGLKIKLETKTASSSVINAVCPQALIRTKPYCPLAPLVHLHPLLLTPYNASQSEQSFPEASNLIEQSTQKTST